MKMKLLSLMFVLVSSAAADTTVDNCKKQHCKSLTEGLKNLCEMRCETKYNPNGNFQNLRGLSPNAPYPTNIRTTNWDLESTSRLGQLQNQLPTGLEY